MVVVVAIVLAFPPPAAIPSALRCRRPEMHSVARHDVGSAHRYLCRFKKIRSSVISKAAGLGRIEIKGDIGAVLQRDEGIVSLLDLKQASHVKVLGRFDDGAEDSLDGDLVFSHDGAFLFYARQTEQFSRDGVHVLDVSDPTEPTETFYQASGGTLRITYYYDGTDEWVVFLDAIDGLVVCRFVRASGSLVEVFRDSAPALKVGGPASAGVHIDPKDPETDGALMYVTTGQTGLQIYDFSNPELPVEIGSWPEVGLAEVEVKRTESRRLVYVATEYWFESALKPEVIVLDATVLDDIKRVRTLRLQLPADDLWRVQGMARVRGRLLVAHSHAGLVAFGRSGGLRARALLGGAHHGDSGAAGAVYGMDVEAVGRRAYLTDAATGVLHVLRLLR